MRMEHSPRAANPFQICSVLEVAIEPVVATQVVIERAVKLEIEVNIEIEDEAEIVAGFEASLMAGFEIEVEARIKP